MTTFFRSCAAAAALAGTWVAAFIHPASAQETQAGKPAVTDYSTPGHIHHGMMQRCGGPLPGMHSHEDMHGMTRCGPEGRGHLARETVEPTLPGQDAFGTIQQIVRMLEADPRTDWSKVNLEALRQHLIDMNDVMLKADVSQTPIDGGIKIAVTGSGRTAEAIQRMVPAHARAIEESHLNGWSAQSGTLPDGVLLTITASDPKEVRHIQGLGFAGIMVSGHHHEPHHLAIARGEMDH
jgi:hypothetical protein